MIHSWGVIMAMNLKYGSQNVSNEWNQLNILMNNNDILRRIRYTFDFGDSKMISIFHAADYKVTRAQVSDWLKKDDDPEQVECTDTELAIFLNGLINDKRGKKDGAQPEPEKRLSNNMIFTKLKIALNLKAEDILAIMGLAEFSMSKHELSALFRKPGHKNYRDCKDQVLRNFLNGMQLEYRDSAELNTGSVWKQRVDPATTPGK